MPDFQAQHGHPGKPGLQSHSERIKRIRKNANPYISGSALPAASPVFFGRTQQLHEIRVKLRNPVKPGCVSLLGERRMGKSSFLNQMYQALANVPGLISIHASAQNWNPKDGPASFFQEMHAAICKALSLSETEPVQDYPAFRDFIAGQAKQKIRFALLLDEFEFMAGNPDFDAVFFSNLRVLGDFSEYAFGYLIASRQPLHVLCKDHKIEASSFWNIFGFPYVAGLLQDEEARQLIETPLRASLKKNVTANVDKILHLTGCHPALIQMVMIDLWQAFQSGYQADISRFRHGLRPYYKSLWEYRNAAEQKMLLEIADGRKPTAGATADELRQRGLITTQNKLFSSFFGELLQEWAPPGKSLADWIGEVNKGLTQGAGAFDGLLDAAKKAGEVYNALHGKEDKTDD
ncbi:MAG: ATP-binding protein [Gammaproteobacteria bacterium]|nr:ATP-binding protein [Gammaproteobacteria bacterium]